MSKVEISFTPVGNGHELALQTVGDPSGIKILMLHGGPGYYWLPDNLITLHNRLSNAGHSVCLQALNSRGCGVGPATSRYSDLLDDSLLKRAQDLTHFEVPDILLGHSTGCMVALTALMEKTCTPRETILLSPYSASLGEHAYWMTTKAQKYPRAFRTLHDFVAENWKIYKGNLPADLAELLYHYWGVLFFALPDKALQVKAKMAYLNFHTIDALPHMGTEDGEPYIAHHDMLKKWPNLPPHVMDVLWRIGTISANWWQAHYQHGYPFMQNVKAHQFDTPIHILSGLTDEITPPETVQAFADILNVTPTFAPNAGHLAEAHVQGQLDVALAEFIGKIIR